MSEIVSTLSIEDHLVLAKGFREMTTEAYPDRLEESGEWGMAELVRKYDDYNNYLFRIFSCVEDLCWTVESATNKQLSCFEGRYHWTGFPWIVVCFTGYYKNRKYRRPINEAQRQMVRKLFKPLLIRVNDHLRNAHTRDPVIELRDKRSYVELRCETWLLPLVKSYLKGLGSDNR
jgi:hypothetical protein